MPYFKDTQNDLHFLEQSDIDDGWLGKISGADVWVPITDSDAQAILNPPITLAEAQAAQVANLSAACQAQIYAGFQSSALGAVHTYPAKDKDQTNLSGSVVASLLPGLSSTWSTPFWCEDASGNWSFAPHTAAQIQQVGADGKAAILAALEKNATLSAQVMAAASVAEVQAVVW